MKYFFLTLGLFLPALLVTAELPTWQELADRARWAANAHNVQSWQLVPIPGRPDQKRLLLDPSRLLPETDPPQRQLTISLGAFLAVLEDEAADRGALVQWEQDETNPGVLLTLTEGPRTRRPQPVVDALTAPTVKYRTAPLRLDEPLLRSQEAQSTAVVGVRWLTDPAEASAVKTWAQNAFDLEMDLPRTRDESIRYTRYGEAALKAAPWGITLVPNFPDGNLFWIETLAALFPQSPQDYARSAKELFTGALKPVEQVLVITSRGNDRRTQIETGRLLQRLWLEVRAQGGELLPLSQGLQEFPEMQPYYTEAHQRWARDGETVQMVLALFQPAPGKFQPSPRIDATSLMKP